jgi:hypothetical protein
MDICHAIVNRAGDACNLPLSECTVQEHWERRLKDYRLTMRRASGPQITTGEGDHIERLVPLTGAHSEMRGAPLMVPQDHEVAEIFVADATGLRFSEPVSRRFWPNVQDPNPSCRHKVTC